IKVSSLEEKISLDRLHPPLRGRQSLHRRDARHCAARGRAQFQPAFGGALHAVQATGRPGVPGAGGDALRGLPARVPHQANGAARQAGACREKTQGDEKSWMNAEREKSACLSRWKLHYKYMIYKIK